MFFHHSLTLFTSPKALLLKLCNSSIYLLCIIICQEVSYFPQFIFRLHP